MPKPIPVVTLTVRIPVALAKRVKLRAAVEDKTATEVVIAALDAHVKAVTATEVKNAS